MRVGKAASAVGGATFLSRIFGLVRDQIFAALLGAGYFADSFIVAFRIPNLLRDLFAEGALSSAFVPTFTEREVKKGSEETWRFANLVLGALLALVGTVTLAGILFAPQVVSLIAPGFGGIEGKHELTTLLTRIMFPFLPMVAMAALFMGMLNVKGSFALPAFAPVLFNVVSILFGLALYYGGAGERGAVIGWSLGTLFGGVAQAGIQLPKLFRLGFSFRPTLSGWRTDSGLRQVGLLMVPAIVGLAATQVNILVNTILASLLEQGSPSWLNYAFRLMQFPIGVFGVAISVASLPTLSKNAATSDHVSLRENLSASLRMVFLLTIPSAVGLWLLGEPIVRLIFQHGSFDASDTSATAGALAAYAVGLPAYAAVKVLAPALYTVKSARVPAMASILAVAANLAFNLSVYRTLGFKGLALGTSLAALTNFVILEGALQRRGLGLSLGTTLGHLAKVAIATAAMGYVGLTAYRFLHPHAAGLAGELLETLVPVFLSACVYFAILAALGVKEVSGLAARLLRFR